MSRANWWVRSLDGLSEPTSDENRRQVSRVAAVLAGSAGLIASLVVSINLVRGFSAPGYEIQWLAALAAVSLPLAPLCLWIGPRASPWLLHPLAAAWSIGTAAVAYLHGPTLMIPAATAGFMIIGLIVFLVFERYAALVHTAFIALLLGVILSVQDGNTSPLTRFVVVMSVVLVSGITVSWLMGRVQALARAERAARDELALTKQLVEAMRERQRLEDLFGRHVSPEVAARALGNDTGVGGELREATALFVDLVGSTSLYMDNTPQEVAALLTQLFDLVVEAVSAEGGSVNRFTGDGALCIFGAPSDQPDHARRALRASRRILVALNTLKLSWPAIDGAIGVSSGIVLAGNVGTDSRYEYTLLGDPVNEASRLTEHAKTRPSRVAVSGSSFELAGDERANWTPIGNARMRGRNIDTQLYEPAVMSPA